MANRIVYIDNLKSAAILLVIIGHTTLLLSPMHKESNFLLAIIHSFHMPLFMAICGYFFRSSLQLDFKSFLKKKFVALMLPALSWSLIKFGLSGGGQFI